jgi:hypothetical protein
MARRLPPSIPPEVDEYDGHAGYRARIREVASFKPLVWLGVLIGFGMWYAAGKLSLVMVDPGPDSDNVVGVLAYVVFGGVGFFAYLIALGLVTSKHAQRGVLAAGALAIAFAAFYPFARDYRLTPVPETAVAVADYERWLNELRASGRVADAGVVPPLVAVRERDGAVLVRNVAGRPLLIGLALVQERRERDGSRAWRRCPLFAGPGSFEVTRYWLPPFVSAWFEPSAYCAEGFGYSDIEYRIGDAQSPVALSWRSTSALGPAAE